MFSAQAWQDWKPVFLEHGASMFFSLLHMIVIVIAGWIIIRVIRRLLRKMEAVLVRHRDGDDALTRVATEKRVRTLTGVLKTAATIGIWAMVVVSGLNEMGINIGPILAGVGIAGLAVGFGAQNLVRDVITGFFIILENQVRVGDVAVVNGTGGLVEAVTFRTITLRDVTGTLHVFPHGSIITLANQTADWSAAVLDVAVSYSTDVEKATRVMQEVYDQMSMDAGMAGKLLEPIEVFGIERFGPNELVIQARIKTAPREQWAVAREYRKRLKNAFDHEGIEAPIPQRTVHVQTIAASDASQAASAA